MYNVRPCRNMSQAIQKNAWACIQWDCVFVVLYIIVVFRLRVEGEFFWEIFDHLLYRPHHFENDDKLMAGVIYWFKKLLKE